MLQHFHQQAGVADHLEVHRLDAWLYLLYALAFFDETIDQSQKLEHFSYHVSPPTCRENWLKSPRVAGIGASFVIFFSLSSSAPMLQHHFAHHPSWNATASLPPQSLLSHTCTSTPNSTFLKQYQPSTSKEAGN
ncbi:hypothetical protein V6N11_025634 [Hibiscus sabdariffa]|uniref:Uncharacterized protein n=1 Tax=Hibiscus sabdariffa TaxID=183260 RepID=A0ABR2SU53_9ROSI